MEISDMSMEQMVAYQAQSVRSELSAKLMKSAVQQEQKMVDILAESAVQVAKASANGRGSVVDMLV